MRLAFVNPPLIGRRQKAVEAEDCCWGVGARVLPAMLLACASEAQRAGHEVKFLDLSLEDAGALHEFAPDHVVHALAWQYHKQVNEAMARICGDVPRVALAVPPGYAMHYARADPPPAVVLHGEVEWLIKDWLTLPHRGDNCLADLGPVDYGLVPDAYWENYSAVIYQVTRGCPYRCRFCVWGGSTVTDPTFRMRPAALVADDLKEIRMRSVAARGSPIPLYLLAAQLTTDERWIRKFQVQMAGEPYAFQSNVNLGDLTAEKLRLLMKCGLVSTSAGLEAMTTRLLKKLGKPYTFERAVHGLLTLHEVGIKFRTHIRYGFGENDDDVQESATNVHKLRAAGMRGLRIDFAPIVHYEGTQIFEDAQGEYALERLPKRNVDCLVMADPPDWMPFTDALREYGWLKQEGARK